MMIQFTFTLILFAFISGTALAVPTVSTDRELPVITELSNLELELDARITYEVAKGSDAKLENVLRIEQELIASSIHESNPDLLARILQLKHSALDREANGTVLNSQKAYRAKAQLEWRENRGLTGRTESDPPELTAISVDKASVDVSGGPQTISFTLEATDETGVSWLDGYVYFNLPGGSARAARGSEENPQVFTLTLDSDDPSGAYLINFVALRDTLGNSTTWNNSRLMELGLPASIEVTGGTESDPPELTAISVDKASVDVSGGPQTISFALEATDETGVSWLDGFVYFNLPGGSARAARGSEENPQVFTLTLDSDDPSGAYLINFVALRDTLGNSTTWNNSRLMELGLPASIEVTGGTESDPPELTAISVDKASVDVSGGPQTISFTLEATDETGVSWLDGFVYFNLPGGSARAARGSEENPQVFTLTLDSDDPSGAYLINFVALRDTLGNSTRWNNSRLMELGLPSFIYLLADGESTSNITLNADTSITNVSENSEINYSLKIENLASVPTDQLTFELKSTNVRVSAVSQAGSSACGISSINYNSTVSCALSGVDANTSKVLTLKLAPGISGTASFNANIVADIPDISYLNNYVSASLVVDPDGDGDGIADNTDNCPSDSNSVQLDTDSDGNGNACDIDDDNDTVLDVNDAFPLDATETIDTDSDGTGNNADTDDDGDGVIDSNDAYPLISLNGLTDTDLDGLPNNCDAACLEAGMTADTDDDGDGVSDDDDAFPLDSSETVDSDFDGVGDNSDPFPNDALYSIDSDSDGMPDEWETLYGLDPNDPSDATSDQDNDGIIALDEFLAGTIPSGSLDIDGNENYDALTDGLLLLRGMFGLDGSALITGTIASDATYTDSVDIESRIEILGDLADIDGNGEIDALTDGLLTLRYLFGLEGDTLIAGVVASDATRTTAVDIEAHLKTLMPAL